MVHHTTTSWVEDLVFDAHLDQFTFRVQGSISEEKPQGPGPKRLMLSSLAGCTGMDVASLLKKMRVPFDSFDIDVEANLTEEHPKVYSSIHLIYRLAGDSIKVDKLKKAIDLSLFKYCGVAEMLRKQCPITFDIVVNGLTEKPE